MLAQLSMQLVQKSQITQSHLSMKRTGVMKYNNIEFQGDEAGGLNGPIVEPTLMTEEEEMEQLAQFIV